MIERLRGRLTYANVAATLALFLALTGGIAWALEANSVKSRHIVDGQVKAVDVSDQVTAGVLTGRSGVAGSANTSTFFGPSGSVTGQPQEFLEETEQLTPNSRLAVKDLGVELNTAPGPDAQWDIALYVDGTSTALGCEIAGSNTSCDSGAAGVTIPPSSRVALRMRSGEVAPADTGLLWGLRIAP